MSNAKEIFDTMLTRFDSDAASGLNAIFQFELDDADPYFVTIDEGTAVYEQGEHDDATVTLSMDTDTLEEVMSGELDGMQAFMQGKIRADGDIMLATKLTQIFPVP
ncbi:SCP-2 sterol transfer family protein [Marinomonas gallaica]|uniref:SCP-2 sterol transfer family protein n=1 Tax=Marinomonas gallaica TaxID=1806667 RepID=A0A1C3JSV9_9GAMM|nr:MULTISPECIES: SCP2 sterol-binding domain-containing protein [Marinomonas]MCO4786066.1 SCP2 sterol-binding domain-containing protein [Marinomonas atlantica]SBT18195.1 SCP-2 sterol transfer family protein [Marinomonas gallaica]SBT22575.1 SCP-2 sterol transfer family protein [Marinomonas gallaica]